MSQTTLTGKVLSPIAEYITHHPEIDFIRLIWTWDYHAVYEEDGYIWEEIGDYLDEEYTFCGNRKDALTFLSKHGCWDGYDFKDLEDATNENVLSLVHEGSSEASGNYLRDERPWPYEIVTCCRDLLRAVDLPRTPEEEHFTTQWNKRQTYGV